VGRRTTVVDPLEHRFPAELPAIARARRALRDWLAPLDVDRVDDLLIVCSELVTNVIQHTAAGAGTFRAGIEDDDVWLEVEDTGGGFALSTRSAEDVPAGDERGRGLLIAAALTDDLVVRHDSDCGCTVVRCVVKDVVRRGLTLDAAGRRPRWPGAAPAR
jgi:anti-sigma regulatory factor (Ser/Thr protein kinase)